MSRLSTRASEAVERDVNAGLPWVLGVRPKCLQLDAQGQSPATEPGEVPIRGPKRRDPHVQLSDPQTLMVSFLLGGRAPHASACPSRLSSLPVRPAWLPVQAPCCPTSDKQPRGKKPTPTRPAQGPSRRCT